MATREDWDRINCQRKVKYGKLKNAEKALKDMRWRKGIAVKSLEPYKCRVCTSYHLGNPRGSAPRRKAEIEQMLGIPAAESKVNMTKDSKPLDERIAQGIQEADEGRTKDLGDFAQYADTHDMSELMNDDNLTGAGQLDIGEALRLAVTQRMRISREGWNGRDMFVVYQEGYPDGIAINANTARATGIPEGTVMVFQPYLMMCTADGSFVPWLASQSDLLAHDWIAERPITAQ